MFEILTTSSTFEMVLQLFTAALLGALLGAERKILAHRAAGMRTYGLVAMGAALFVMMALLVSPTLAPHTSLDVMRVVSGIITGVGFIGAGAIIFKDETDTVTGLTTAAGLWVAAGIGIAVAFKLYMLAVFAALFTLFVFTMFWRVENHFIKEHEGEG